MSSETKDADRDSVSEYLGAVLDKDRPSAVAVVERMLESGTRMREIFEALAASQVGIGEMWAKGIASVADEHFATTTTLGCIDIVAERLHGPRAGGRGLAFLCTVEGEYHLVGLRMFSELLRNQGWETVMSGSGFSAESLVERAKALRGRTVDLLCIAATMPSCLPLLAETLRAIRTEPVYANTKVVVGGPVFRSRKARSMLSGDSAGGSLVDCIAWEYGSALKFTGSL